MSTEYEVMTIGAPGAAPVGAPVSTGPLDPVVVSVDGRLFAVVVIGGVAAAVWWAWARTRKGKS